MEPNHAAAHLQVIRTLMENAALYRRALAPIMIFTGALGLLAAVLGTFVIESTAAFILYWLGIAVAALLGTFLLARRQAFRAGEAFWSPPTRRVASALLPPLTAGFMISLALLVAEGDGDASLQLPLLWILLYGCALNAAAFFTPSSLRVFGWTFLLGGCALLGASLVFESLFDAVNAHGLMGFFFGVLHLGYGVYLSFTEPRNPAT